MRLRLQQLRELGDVRYFEEEAGHRSAAKLLTKDAPIREADIPRHHVGVRFGPIAEVVTQSTHRRNNRTAADSGLYRKV
jgi:hypothetical protein